MAGALARARRRVGLRLVRGAHGSARRASRFHPRCRPNARTLPRPRPGPGSGRASRPPPRGKWFRTSPPGYNQSRETNDRRCPAPQNRPNAPGVDLPPSVSPRPPRHRLRHSDRPRRRRLAPHPPRRHLAARHRRLRRGRSDRLLRRRHRLAILRGARQRLLRFPPTGLERAHLSQRVGPPPRIR